MRLFHPFKPYPKQTVGLYQGHLVGFIIWSIFVVFVTDSTAAPGDISTIAGNGTGGYSGDGGIATNAMLSDPMGVALDADDNLYIADLTNHCIRRVDAVTGEITTVAGTGMQGFNGDGIAATLAQLSYPFAIALDGTGNLYIADSTNHRVRRVDKVTGLISTVAGTGSAGSSGDGGAATVAQMREPIDLAFDSFGNLFIAELRNHQIRKVDGSNGNISTVAGSGTLGYNGDGIAATTADLYYPSGIVLGSDGDLFIGDTGNDRIRRVDAVTGLIETVAGNGVRGFSGDGGLATAAQIAYSTGIGLDGVGNLFIADQDNHRVRRVDATTGAIATVAGAGTNGYSGDGGPAVSAQLYFPYDVAFDSKGHLYIADPNNDRIRRVESAGELPEPVLRVAKPKPFPATRKSSSSRPQAVVVKNEGSGPLEGLAVSVAGRHRRDFRVKPLLQTRLAPGATSHFSLTFKPRDTGIRKADVTVQSENAGAITWPIKGKGK
jgi:streptogramin lyase